MGRVTDYVENDASGVYAYERTATYDAKSEVTHDVVTSVRSDGTYVSTTSYDYGAAVTSGGVTTYTGAYQGGDVTHSHTTTTKGGTAQPTTDTVNTYVWWDSAQQAVTTFNPDTSHSTLNTSTYSYDSLGHISSVAIADGRPRTVTFVTDNDGEVLRRDEADSLSSGDPHEIHWYFNGVPVGDVTNNGASNVDYAVSISEHITAPGTGPFLNGSATSTSYADFDESYDPINGLDYDSTASSYTVNTGDTLESIAQQLWGDASYWYMIADANGLSSDADLVSGMDLIIPNKIHNDANSATTYAVYDPNEALGNDSPTAPKTPKHHSSGCGVVGEIIVAVVAVVVAYYAPYLLPVLTQLGTVGSAVASAAIGSVVSQGVGLAIGAQSKFSFAQVGLAAISAGIGAEVGPATGITGTGIASAVERGVIGNVVTQGVEVATGLQKKFDFADVAAAGVSAGVIWGVDQLDGYNPKLPMSDLGNDLKGGIGGMAGAIASAATRTLVNGSDFGDNIIRALPDAIGETIGDLVAGAMSGPQSNNDTSPGTQATQIVPLSGDTSLEYTPPSAPLQPLTEAVNPFQFTMPDGSIIDYTPPDALPAPMQVAIDPSKLPGAEPDAAVNLFTDPAIDPNILQLADGTMSKEGLLPWLERNYEPSFLKPSLPNGDFILLPDGRFLTSDDMELDLLKYQAKMPSLVTGAIKVLSGGGGDPPSPGDAENELCASATGEYYSEFPENSPQRQDFENYMKAGFMDIRPAPFDGMDQLRAKMVSEAFPKH